MCSYLDIHNELMHSPKSIIDLKNSSYKNYLHVMAFNIEKYKSKNIEEALKSHVTKQSLIKDYTSDIHKTYGKYYIIKYKTIWN